MENVSTSSAYVKKVSKDTFQKQVDDLANKLKQICDQDGNEKAPKQSAEIFHKLSQIYFERNIMVSLIRSATLLNAAITRKPSNIQEIKNDLNKLCFCVLKQAGAKQLDSDLIAAAAKVKEKVKVMRNEVKQDLDSLKLSETINETNEEIENAKTETIRNLQNKIATDYIHIMAEILQYCKTVMGNTPCRFTLVGMGSLARQEITPYSDFEHIIVLEENCQQRSNYEEILKHFRWLSVIFQIIVINLQETIVPSVDINCFKTTENGKMECWFYDKITTRGISFDGMMPHACKFPLGQKVLSDDTKQYETELIKPVDEMLKYLASQTDPKNGYHLKDILTKVCYVGGDKNIFESFQSKVYQILDNQDQKEKYKEIKKTLIEDLDNFATRSNFLKHTSKSFNIKKDLYRSSTIFISALGQAENIHASSCFDIIEDLAQKKLINDKLKSKLMYAVAVACELRLTRYMKQKRQDDQIKSSISHQDAVQTLLENIKETDLISYFQIVYALQCRVTKKFDLKKVHFYSDPKLLNCRLYYCLGQFENFVQSAKENKAIQYNPTSRLKDADEILDQLEKQTKLDLNPKKFESWNHDYLLERNSLEIIYHYGLELRNAENNDDAKEIFELLIEVITFKNSQTEKKSYRETTQNIVENKKKLLPHTAKYELQTLEQLGLCCRELNQPTQALDYLQRSMKIYEETSVDIDSDVNVAITLHNIGSCFMNMHKPADALNYLQQSMKIYEKTLVNIGPDVNVAITLHNIGMCFKDMHKPADALNYLQRSMKIVEKSSPDIDSHVNVARMLHNIGMCLKDMHKPADAFNYLQQSLKIYQKASLDISSDVNVATTLNNIGMCFMDMHKPADALNYLQNSMKINENTSLDIGLDVNVARTLNDIGTCFINIHKPTDAMNYLQRSMKIYQKASFNIDLDVNVAMTLNNIGKCFMHMHKPADALDYLQRSMKIHENTSTNIDSDLNVAMTLNNIGVCFKDMHKLANALDYLQRSMKIHENTSTNIDSDVNVAMVLNNIGTCFQNMHKPADALDYLQRSIKIYENTSTNIDSNVNVAMALNNIGTCFQNMHKPADALDYLQRSMKIYENASLNIDTDVNVAMVLNNIGTCFEDMHKPADALDYLQRSMKIYENTSLNIDSHVNVATMLNNISKCFMGMHKPADALDYLQQSMKIYEKISANIGSDVNVARTLHNIGMCFKDMHKPTDALDYLQRSMKIYETSSVNIGSDVNVAITLHNIGMCFKDMHKPADALNYLQRSMKIYENSSVNIGSDVNVARTLHNIGMCFKDMHKPADALNYLQRLLKIYENTSANSDLDLNVSRTLNNIGMCFMDMHKPADALNYLQRSMKIYKNISANIGLDVNVARTLNNIGLCFMNMHKLADALDYLQRSMKIYQKASLNIDSDVNVARILYNIAFVCVCVLYRSWLVFYENAQPG